MPDLSARLPRCSDDAALAEPRRDVRRLARLAAVTVLADHEPDLLVCRPPRGRKVASAVLSLGPDQRDRLGDLEAGEHVSRAKDVQVAVLTDDTHAPFEDR